LAATGALASKGLISLVLLIESEELRPPLGFTYKQLVLTNILLIDVVRISEKIIPVERGEFLLIVSEFLLKSSHTIIGGLLHFSIEWGGQGRRLAKPYSDLPALLRLTGADVALIPAMLVGRSEHIRSPTGSAREVPRVPLGSRSQGRPAPCEAGAVTGVKGVVVVVVIVVHTIKGGG
jgi:hypothetical protein